MQTEFQKIERELKIRNYSPKTMKSYLFALNLYFSFKKTSYEKFNEENIRNFFLICENKKPALVLG